jgi:hypothetical protein
MKDAKALLEELGWIAKSTIDPTMSPVKPAAIDRSFLDLVRHPARALRLVLVSCCHC